MGVRKVIVEVVTELPDKNKDKYVLCNKIHLEQNKFFYNCILQLPEGNHLENMAVTL